MRIAAALALSFALACTSKPACDTIARPGLVVRVSDRLTSAPITGATVTATSLDHIETLVEVGGGMYYGAYEQPGTYLVGASMQGYQQMTAQPVVVGKDDCHVITQTIDVMLTPQP